MRLAQQFGAVGVILYSDPMDYHGLDKMADNETFPHTDRLPDNDVQRGTVVAEDNGDILTPLLPAKGTRGPGSNPTWSTSFVLFADYVSRKTLDAIFEDRKLPSIPATVIGFGDAQKLLQELEGFKAPQAWQGLLPLVYNVGGRFKSANKYGFSAGSDLVGVSHFVLQDQGDCRREVRKEKNQECYRLYQRIY